MCVASVDVLKRSIFAHRFPCSMSVCLLTTHSGILCHVIAGLSLSYHFPRSALGYTSKPGCAHCEDRLYHIFL